MQRIFVRRSWLYSSGLVKHLECNVALASRVAFTANTDFSNADVDARQTNLTRFSLFFPETRDFFLQDAGIFDFGGVSRNGRPFFSRRIGIGSDGEPVDVRAAAKLTGRVGRINFGLLAECSATP